MMSTTNRIETTWWKNVFSIEPAVSLSFGIIIRLRNTEFSRRQEGRKEGCKQIYGTPMRLRCLWNAARAMMYARMKIC